MNRDDVGVLESRCGARLLKKPLKIVGIAFGIEAVALNLDGDPSAECRLLCLVDITESAAGDVTHDAVFVGDQGALG